MNFSGRNNFLQNSGTSLKVRQIAVNDSLVFRHIMIYKQVSLNTLYEHYNIEETVITSNNTNINMNAVIAGAHER